MGAHAEPELDALVEVPTVGRRFPGRQRVRLGDITATGRLRLDALVRYLQDVANDDAYDSGIDNPGAWVVRRTVIDVRRSAQLREDLELTTFCSATGACWAERRTSVRGSSGAAIEAAALWVQIDAATGRPLRLGPDFDAVYGPSTEGRTVKARLRLTDPPPLGAPAAPFVLRRSDLDVLGHVNNAVYWAMLEEVLEEVVQDAPGRFELEHHHPLDGQATVRLRRDGERLWVCRDDGQGTEVVAAAARWRS